MEVIRINDLKNIPKMPFLYATIGNFDGIHLGHQQIIKQTKTAQFKSAVITFHPHPRSFFTQQVGTYLTSIEDKQQILMKFEIDYFIILDFTLIHQFTKEEFIHFLKKLSVKKLICGSNFRFGKDKMGNISDLMNHFDVENENLQVKGKNVISSTAIRNTLSEGNIDLANQYLGRYYQISGKVIYGNQIGTKIGFPTANISVEDYFLCAKGVYLVLVSIKNEKFYGLANIGHNPTINFSQNLRIEVHILDYNKNIYNEMIQIEFIQFIRHEVHFQSKEALILQLKSDLNTAKMMISAL